MSKQYIKDGQFYNGSYIELNDCMVSNPTEDMLIAAGYTEYTEPVHEETQEEALQKAKTIKLEEIRNYDSSSNVNSFTLGGTSMWIDFNERARIRQSIDAYKNLGKTEMTKWFNGKEFTYTLDEWQKMLDELSVYASEALNVTEKHKWEVNALTSIDEVKAYDITAGYPEKLVFDADGNNTIDKKED